MRASQGLIRSAVLAWQHAAPSGPSECRIALHKAAVPRVLSTRHGFAVLCRNVASADTQGRFNSSWAPQGSIRGCRGLSCSTRAGNRRRYGYYVTPLLAGTAMPSWSPTPLGTRCTVALPLLAALAKHNYHALCAPSTCPAGDLLSGDVHVLTASIMHFGHAQFLPAL